MSVSYTHLDVYKRQLTMYDANSFFVENPIKRYNIAAWMPLQYNADGSLDIYIQKDCLLYTSRCVSDTG